MHTQKQRTMLTVSGLLCLAILAFNTLFPLILGKQGLSLLSAINAAMNLAFALCLLFKTYGKPMIVSSGAKFAMGIVGMLSSFGMFIEASGAMGVFSFALVYVPSYLLGYVPYVCILLLSFKDDGNDRFLKYDKVISIIGTAIAVFSCAASLITAIPTVILYEGNRGELLLSYAMNIPYIVCLVLALLGLRGSNEPSENYGGGFGGESAKNTPSGSKYYVEMLVHVILLLVTCGVWQYVWIYKTTRFTNEYSSGEYRNPVTKLLLCMFVPFYHIYWTYKTAKEIENASHKRGIYIEIATVCTVISVFIGVIAPILLQDAVNKHESASTSLYDEQSGQ